MKPRLIERLQRIKWKATQKAIDDWNAAVVVAVELEVEVETANASTTPTTQRSRHGDCPDYCSLAGRAPALQTNKDITIPQVNQELIDALEEATKVEQENGENCHQKHYDVHAFSRDKLTTYDSFKNHGIESAHPGINKYKRLFLTPRGDFHQAV